MHDTYNYGAERLFQSTSPVWRTTKYRSKSDNSLTISIHVPRVEDDNMLSVRIIDS